VAILGDKTTRSEIGRGAAHARAKQLHRLKAQSFR
jgi:hypothetical protein